MNLWLKVSQAKGKKDRGQITSSPHKEKRLCAETHLRGCWVLKTRPSVHSLEGQDLDKDAADQLCVNYGENGGLGDGAGEKKEERQ